MNIAADNKGNVGMKGCAVVLIVAVLVLLAQAVFSQWTHPQGGEAEVVEEVSALSADARHLARQYGEWDVPLDASGLRATRARMAARIQRLAAQPAAHRAPDTMAAVVAAWAGVEAAAGQLETRQSERAAALAALDQSLEQVPAFKAALDVLVREMIASGSAASQVYLVLHQVVLVDEMVQPLAIARVGGDAADTVAGELAEDIAAVERVLIGLRNGDAEMALRRLRNRRALAALGRVQAQWAQWRPMLEQVRQQIHILPATQTAVLELERAVETLLLPASALAVPSSVSRHSAWVRMAAGILALLSATGLWQASMQQRRRWEEQAARAAHREQEALARLLDEMGALAEGDLTVRTTVNTGPTSALAEAINFAVEQLASRVQAMTAPLARMASQGEQARVIAIEVTEVGRYQVQELTAALTQMEQVVAGVNTVLAQVEANAHIAQPALIEAVRHCVDGAVDVAAMMTTLHTVIGRISGENARALQILEDLAQALEDVRHAATAFVVPD